MKQERMTIEDAWGDRLMVEIGRVHPVTEAKIGNEADNLILSIGEETILFERWRVTILRDALTRWLECGSLSH